jgi:hypothetical protein
MLWSRLRDHEFFFSSSRPFPLKPSAKVVVEFILNRLRFAKTTPLSCRSTKLDFGPAPQSASWMEKGVDHLQWHKPLDDTFEGRLIQCMTLTSSMTFCDVRLSVVCGRAISKMTSSFRQQGRRMCTLSQLCVNFCGLSGQTFL